MRVSVSENPKHPGGLAIQFPYDKFHVDTIKQVLGLSWDKTLKAWISAGPEVLLDMQRLQIEIGWISKSARAIAEEFRQQLWNVIDCRVLTTSVERFAYQEQGAEFLSLMPRAILADERGTGKSKQSLEAAARVKAQTILILCAPKTTTYNWPQEVEKWVPQYSWGVVPDNATSSKTVKGRKDFWKHRPEIVIANYEKLRLSDWPYFLDWDVVICDELPKVAKHSSTIIHQQLKGILEHAKYFWPLTGAYMEKNLPELYNIFSLLRPAVLGGYMRFKEQHLETDWGGSITGVKNLDLLRDRIGPYILRRTKAEVLQFLPPKLPPENHFVKFSPKEDIAYKTMTGSFNPEAVTLDIDPEENTMVQLLRMRQFCCTPDYFTKELGKGSKFEELVNIIDDWSGQVVVFCYFEEMIARMHEWLELPSGAVISGKVAAKARLERINAFNDGTLGKVLVSTDAGSTGVNITSADLVIHYDQLQNPINMLQREDRLHRIGQENPVTVIHLMYMDSIDYGMYLRNKEEGELVYEVVDGAEIQTLRKLDAARLKRMVEGKL